VSLCLQRGVGPLLAKGFVHLLRKERKPQASDVAHGSNFIWDGSRDEICDLRSRLWPARADDTYGP
jgi:hypothetical protein